MKKVKLFFLLTFGTLLQTAGIYFFKFPNHFSTGGVSGLSIVLTHFLPGISAGTFMLWMNVILLIVGFLFVGKSFGIKTVYCSLLMSIGTRLLELFCPMTAPLTDQPLLELIFSILAAGAGSAVLFNFGASTGGTDIVAMILKKYIHTNVSKVLFWVDFVIVMLTYFAFGVQTWLFCVLGIAAKILVLDNVLENLNSSKYFTIITDKGDEISTFITDHLHKGATMSNAFYGGFSHDGKSVIFTVLSRKDALALKLFVKEKDPKAFMIISTTSDIIGKGFRETV